MTPDADVAAKLASAAIYTVVGTDVFTGPEDDVNAALPDVCGFVTSYASAAPVDMFGVSTKPRIEKAYVQVCCRGAVGDPTTPKTTARAAAAALHRAAPTGYLSSRAIQTEPIYLGPDGKGRYRYTINVAIEKEV